MSAVRVALVWLALLATAGCGGAPAPSDTGTSAAETPEVAVEGSETDSGTDSGEEAGEAGEAEGAEGGSDLAEVDPCTLLSQDQIDAAFADVEDLAAVPEPVRTSPGGTTEMCSWQDVLAGAVLRLELDTIGVIPVPPADPSCSETDCPDPGLGVASRADLREVFAYVTVQLDSGTFRIQEVGLDLTGDEIISLAATVVDKVG